MRKLHILIVGLLILFVASPVSAQSLDEIAAELNSTGRFIEGNPLDETTSIAVDEANTAGVAYIQLDAQDSDADAENLLNSLLGSLNDLNSRYQSIVLYEPGNGAWAVGNSGDPEGAINASLGSFSVANVAQGLEQFTNVLGGGTTTGAAPSTTVAGTGSSTSSGSGFPWLILIVIGGLVWLGFRFMNSRKAKAMSQTAIEADRAEIKEQLKDNADRVIDLGDAVIAKADPELIRIYEEASASYQTVSTEVDDARSAAQVDSLDDQIDKAEWQFEVIEARLEGRRPPVQPIEPTLPPPPTARSTRASDKPKSRPALGQDESVFDDGQPQDPSRPAPRSQRPRGRRRSSSGGGLGGLVRSGVGRMVMGLLFQMILGRGLRQSRRTYGRSTGSSRSNSGGGINAPRGF